MKNNHWQTRVFSVAVGVVCGWILLKPWWDTQTARHADAPPAAAVAPAPVAVVTVSDFHKAAQDGAILGALPASLTGTRVDGALRVDALGQLQVDVGLRRVFDYFLATIGEESVEQIRARIAYYLQQQLPADAAQQAWAILQQYLAYKDALATLPGHDGSYDGMRDSLQRQRDLRDVLLGSTLAEAFFRDDDEYADFALAHVDQLRNPDLSPNERAAATEALLQNVSAHNRQIIQATAVPLQVEQGVNVLRGQGAGEDEVWQFREQQLGADAAGRLAQLDRDRALWEQRYEDYRRQRAAIEASALDAIDKDSEILRLRESYFSVSEQKRVAALDRIGAEARTSE